MTNNVPREVDSIVKLLPLLFSESERGIVIACSAYLEEQIKADIIPSGKRMPFDGLLKILGEFMIQPKLYQILDIIRSIRNDAAHKYTPFSLNSYGQVYSNNLVGKTKSLAYFQSISQVPVNLPNGLSGTIGNLDSLFSGTSISNDAINFVVVTTTLSKYLSDAQTWRKNVAPITMPALK